MILTTKTLRHEVETLKKGMNRNLFLCFCAFVVERNFSLRSSRLCVRNRILGTVPVVETKHVKKLVTRSTWSQRANKAYDYGKFHIAGSTTTCSQTRSTCSPVAERNKKRGIVKVHETCKISGQAF